MLVRRTRGLGTLATGPASYSSSRGWFCPAGEPYIWTDPQCRMQCLSTYAELQAMVAATQGIQCPPAPVTSVEGQPWIASAGGGIPTAPAPTPAPTPAPQPASTPASAWNPPPEQEYTLWAEPTPETPAAQTTTTTTEETTEETSESGRPAIMRPWTAQLPAGIRDLAELAAAIPCWVWVLLALAITTSRKEGLTS